MNDNAGTVRWWIDGRYMHLLVTFPDYVGATISTSLPQKASKPLAGDGTDPADVLA